MPDTWPLDYLDELHEELVIAMMDELSRLKAPQNTLELFFGISSFRT